MNHRTLPSKQAWCFTWLFLRFSPEGWVDWLCAIFCCTSTRFRTRRPQPFFIKKLLQHRHMLYMFHLPWHRKWLHQVKNSEASFFWKKNPWWSIFQAIFWCYFLLLRCFFDVFPPKKNAWRCASSSSGHRRRPTGSWASKMDGTLHVDLLGGWWLQPTHLKNLWGGERKPARVFSGCYIYRLLHHTFHTKHLLHQAPFTLPQAGRPRWIRASDPNAPYQNCLVVQTAARHSKPPP